MKESSDPLDRLLELGRPPAAPAWFEARTLARLRGEAFRPAWTEWLFRLRPVGLGIALAGLAALALYVALPGRVPARPNKEMFEAFDAFVSISAEEESWNAPSSVY